MAERHGGGGKVPRGTLTLHGTETKTYEPGRLCFDLACGTRLSIYNPEPFCSLHKPSKPITVTQAPRGRSGRRWS